MTKTVSHKYEFEMTDEQFKVWEKMTEAQRERCFKAVYVPGYIHFFKEFGRQRKKVE